MPRAVPARLAEYADEWATPRRARLGAGVVGTAARARRRDRPAHRRRAGHRRDGADGHLRAGGDPLRRWQFTPDRDTIVMSALDFPSVRYVYDELAPRLGARVVVVPSDDGISIDEDQAVRRHRRAHGAGRDLARAVQVGLHRRCRAHRGARAPHGRARLARRLPLGRRRAGGRAGDRRGFPHGRRAQVAVRRTRAAASCTPRRTSSARLAPALTGWQAHAHPFAFDDEHGVRRRAPRAGSAARR